MSEDKLKEFLGEGKEWSRLKTSITGVFVQKLPAYRSSPSRLAIEINPVDESGNPTKRRGLMIRSIEELEEFRKILQDEKLVKLQKIIDSVNPKVKGVRPGREEGFIEI